MVMFLYKILIACFADTDKNYEHGREILNTRKGVLLIREYAFSTVAHSDKKNYKNNI